DGLLIDSRRQGKTAEEAGVTALAKQMFSFLGAVAALFAPLGCDGKLLVLQGDVNFLLLEARQLRFDINVIGVFADIDGIRREVGPRAAIGFASAEPSAKQGIELALSELKRIALPALRAALNTCG